MDRIPDPPRLLDERASPDFRAIFGALLLGSDLLEAAVSRIRLAGIDLGAKELSRVGRIRLVVAELNGLTLRSEAEAMAADRARAESLSSLLVGMDCGRIEVRSAPLAGWAPDFSVFHRTGRPWRTLLGPHWFARPYPQRGPAFTSLHGDSAAARASTRFTTLWEGGHDVGPAILEQLRRAKDRVGGSGGLPGARRPGLRAR